ncbi:MAG: hypothetical protein JRM98_05830 [Nitrososphaerota archaeon]|nr:hypothetical protein [Nitrososphaerota archaeon]
MMKALIVGNLTYDVIRTRVGTTVSLGGPPSYAGLFLKRAGVSVDAISSFGDDIRPFLQTINADVNIRSGNPGCLLTTSFSIEINDRRSLTLLKKGCDISERARDGYDVIIINPVMQEVRIEDIEYYRTYTRLLYLDPQGFLRRAMGNRIGLVRDARMLKYLKYVDYMKADQEEVLALSGKKVLKEGIRLLLNTGLKGLLLTEGSKRSSLITADGVQYQLRVPHTNVLDGVGMGDLMGAGFVMGLATPEIYDTTAIKGKEAICAGTEAVNLSDPRRTGLALGVSAAISSANMPALKKVPEYNSALSLARELYQKVKVLKVSKRL